MNIRKVLAGLGIVIVLIVAGIGIFFTVYVRPFMTHMKVVTTIQYDPQLTLVLGGGGNSGILTSDSMVLVIDTKMDEAAQNLYDQVKKIAGTRPITVVNTHVHGDHTKGNVYYKGATIIAGGNYTKEFWISDAGEANLPTQWVKDSLIMKVGDETVTILNLGFSAHTQSDVVVYLQNRKMIFTGDLVNNKQSPVLLGKYNSSSAGFLASFDLMQKRFDIKTVVPGHGDIGGPEVINNFRNFFADMRVASVDDSKKEELIKQYKDWVQIPFLMSPGATVAYMKKEKEK